MKRIIAKLFILLFIILLTSALWSCGAKQKTTFREREAAHVVRSYGFDVNVQNNVKSNVRVTKWGISPINPEQPATYTDPAGEVHRINNAKIDFETSEENLHDNSTINLSGKANEEGDYNKQARETESKSFRLNTILAIGGALAFIVGAALYIRKKGKFSQLFTPKNKG